MKFMRWNLELLNAARGVPWDHSSHEEMGELLAEQQLQPLPRRKVGEPIEKNNDVVNRNFNIFRSDILERQTTHGDGFTPDCPGCIAVRANMAVARNHTATCRDT